MNRSPLVSLCGIVGLAVLLLGLTFLLGNSPKLGLDLQGGASVVLQPDGPASSSALDQTVNIIRSRVDGLGVAEPEITRQGNAIVVNLPGVKDQERARQLVGQTAELRFRPVLEELGPDATQGLPDFNAITSTTVPATTTETTAPGATTVAPATTAPVAATNATAASTSVAGGPGGAVPLPRQEATTTTPTTAGPTTAAPAATTTVAGATTTAGPTTTAQPVPTTIFQTTPPEQDIATNQVVLEQKDSKGKVTDRYLLGPAFLLGTAVESASAVFTTTWEVSLTIKAGAEGIDKWNEQARLCFNGDVSCPGSPGQIAIVLDGVVQSAPRIQPDARAAGQGFSDFQRDKISISGGNMGQKEAQNLALVLKYGSLPVKLKQEAVQTVSATLGKDSLRAGLIAGGIGIGLVILFMLVYYRALALVVVAGLLVSAALVWSVIAYLGQSRGLALSLAGCTGIIVSIGVTVDSYVVYFERLKDDLRAGRSLRNSATRGFKSAYRTIIAADLVSLLGAGVLWYLTVGSVRGFAFFLGLSTIMDMIVAYFFTRPAVILLSRSRFMKGSHVLGITPGEGVVAGATP
jgi:preprotein translocase subunit SecD